MSSAVAAILEGMPEPRDLRLHHVDGRCVITAGSTVLFDYAEADTAMRNMALAALRQLGFTGRAVARLLGLTENYVATLHNAAMREGSAALTGPGRRGRPGKLAGADWEQAAAWRAAGVSDAEIGRRLQVANTTVGRRLGPRRAEPLFPGPAAPGTDLVPAPGADLVPASGAGPGIAGTFSSRYAGAMLLHAFFARADAGALLAAAAGSGGKP